MPLVEPAEILALWKRLPGSDAAVPVHAGGAESLHAFYTKRVLSAVGRALAGKGAMPSWWGECAVARVDASRWKGLADCDSAAEYEKLLSAH
jgi:molybdopterin-guanine dinucleotide biosynthesis protein A